MPVTFFARIHAARKLLNTTEEKVVFYVTRAYDEYTTEALWSALDTLSLASTPC